MSTPAATLDVTTTGTNGRGLYKAGLVGRIIAGGERTVFLGPTGAEVKTVLPEFAVEWKDAKGKPFTQHGAQYGRDFVFANREGGK